VSTLQDSPQVQNLKGRIELRAGNTEAARKAFETALAKDPGSVDALAGLVTVDSSQKQIGRAVARVEGHLASAQPSARGYFLAAQTYLAAKKAPEAETAARKALALDPSYRAAYDILGSLYRQQNKLAEAQQMFDKLSHERPNDVPAQTMAGTLRILRGDMSGARQQFEKVLAIDPRAAIASNNLAYMDAEAGTNLDVALNRAQAAKAALPDDPEVDDTLGWVYIKRGLPALAVTPLEQAVAKDPDNALYHYHLGTAHAKAGERDRARASLQRALSLSSSFTGADDARRTLETLGR
jgi:tetratricopeptide (TPR) repeat protein